MDRTGTDRLRDASSEGGNVRELSFGETSVGDELTLPHVYRKSIAQYLMDRKVSFVAEQVPQGSSHNALIIMFVYSYRDSQTLACTYFSHMIS
jgi:hypothetical protein